jgi:hypothetical protein
MLTIFINVFLIDKCTNELCIVNISFISVLYAYSVSWQNRHYPLQTTAAPPRLHCLDMLYCGPETGHHAGGLIL